MTPGTKVFCGEPLMYVEPSRIDAHAKIVDGDTSGSLAAIAASRLSAVSLMPTARREALRVGRPQHDDLVELVGGLELADVLTDLLEVRVLVLAGQAIVRALALVGRDKVGVVDGR